MQSRTSAVPTRPNFTDVPEARRRNMSAIRARDTKPEYVVRRLLHRLGYRFRLHRKDLPGRPDIVLPSRRKVILVHGCFWHRHGCRNSVLPRARREWWEAKLRRNAERDESNLKELCELGWSPLVVWECEIGDRETLTRVLLDHLGPAGSTAGRSMVQNYD
ncbi:very short patch repair endonuclease [Inquilinus limosus]|uniref:very short patch repair endonuclease n=1 Tax=Inquilinus limosus TaxID=171674 RepID=UPI0009DBE166|nr:very short patch repair endonuclease [Inquilinus limosus]